MKKLISLVLMLALCVSTFTACGQEPAKNNESNTKSSTETSSVATNDSDLESAKKYLSAMYRKAPSTHVEDFEVVGKVKVGEKSYDIEWTADSETVKIVKGENNMVTIDIDEKNPEEVIFNLTAKVTDDKGNSESVSFEQKVPAAIILDAGMSYEEIVTAAYTLEDGLDLGEEYRLFGKIVKIDNPYSDEYKNITVTIQVGDMSDNLIQCFRMTGEGADKLAEGDEITVKGLLKNYKGTIEFDKGCQFLGLGEQIDQSAVVNAAYKLEDGLSMPSASVLKGKIVKIDTPYNDEYKNITVTIVVDGMEEQPIQCFRMTGEGADKLAEGDEIVVAGTIKNYKGTIEFDKGCKLVSTDAFMSARTAVAAYSLEDGISMTAPVTLTGKVVSIDTEYNPEYKNVTVTIVVDGLDEYKIQCFRLSGEGAESIAVDNIITVTGIIKNYKGTIEFDKGCTLDAVNA